MHLQWLDWLPSDSWSSLCHMSLKSNFVEPLQQMYVITLLSFSLTQVTQAAFLCYDSCSFFHTECNIVKSSRLLPLIVFTVPLLLL